MRRGERLRRGFTVAVALGMLVTDAGAREVPASAASDPVPAASAVPGSEPAPTPWPIAAAAPAVVPGEPTTSAPAPLTLVEVVRRALAASGPVAAARAGVA